MSEIPFLCVAGLDLVVIVGWNPDMLVIASKFRRYHQLIADTRIMGWNAINKLTE